MTLTTPELNFKAYTYKNSSTPVQLTDKSIKLVKDPSNPDSYVAPPGKILLKINYTSLNPVDVKLHHLATSLVSLLVNNNNGFGRDFSGEVLSIGDNVKTNVKVGDLVQGIYHKVYSQGTASQYLLVDPNEVDMIAKPDNISLAEASSWPTVFETALLMSKDLKYKDSKVLVIGGGTSVGRYLVQLAKQGGAKEVVVTCSPRTEDVIKSLGADTIIDYTKHKNILYPVLESVKSTGKFDYILDSYGGHELFPEINNILTEKIGRYYSIVGDYPGSSFYNLISTVSKVAWRQLLGALGLLSFNYKFIMLDNFKESMQEARDLIGSGNLKIFVDSIYPFNQLDQAIEKLDSGKAAGKVVIEVAKE